MSELLDPGNRGLVGFLLAMVDCNLGREALTSFVIRPAMLLQGTLAIVLLSFAAMAMTIGDYPVLGVGLWSSALFLLCLGALWVSAGYERRKAWVARGRPGSLAECLGRSRGAGGRRRARCRGSGNVRCRRPGQVR